MMKIENHDMTDLHLEIFTEHVRKWQKKRISCTLGKLNMSVLGMIFATKNVKLISFNKYSSVKNNCFEKTFV